MHEVLPLGSLKDHAHLPGSAPYLLVLQVSVADHAEKSLKLVDGKDRRRRAASLRPDCRTSSEATSPNEASRLRATDDRRRAPDFGPERRQHGQPSGPQLPAPGPR